MCEEMTRDRLKVTAASRIAICSVSSDECVNFAIQKGLDASRSKIKYFRHNDTEHLEELLEQQAAEDRRSPKQAKTSRRFLIVEGIYMNTGTVCNIDKVRGSKVVNLFSSRIHSDLNEISCRWLC